MKMKEKGHDGTIALPCHYRSSPSNVLIID
jgi:hypothetical protein